MEMNHTISLTASKDVWYSELGIIYNTLDEMQKCVVQGIHYGKDKAMKEKKLNVEVMAMMTGFTIASKMITDKLRLSKKEEKDFERKKLKKTDKTNVFITVKRDFSADEFMLCVFSLQYYLESCLDMNFKYTAEQIYEQTIKKKEAKTLTMDEILKQLEPQKEKTKEKIEKLQEKLGEIMKNGIKFEVSTILSKYGEKLIANK